jgi:hypothetical protein
VRSSPPPPSGSLCSLGEHDRLRSRGGPVHLALDDEGVGTASAVPVERPGPVLVHLPQLAAWIARGAGDEIAVVDLEDDAAAVAGDEEAALVLERGQLRLEHLVGLAVLLVVFGESICLDHRSARRWPRWPPGLRPAFLSAGLNVRAEARRLQRVTFTTVASLSVVLPGMPPLPVAIANTGRHCALRKSGVLVEKVRRPA